MRNPQAGKLARDLLLAAGHRTSTRVRSRSRHRCRSSSNSPGRRAAGVCRRSAPGARPGRSSVHYRTPGPPGRSRRVGQLRSGRRRSADPDAIDGGGRCGQAGPLQRTCSPAATGGCRYLGQQLVYAFSVPKGMKDLDVDVRVRDAGLHDGRPADRPEPHRRQCSGLGLRRPDAIDADLHPETDDALLVADSAARAVGGVDPVRRRELVRQDRHAVARDRCRSDTVSTAPTPPCRTAHNSDQSRGRHHVATVRVKNTGNSPEIYYVDAREPFVSTYSLGFLSDNNGTLPITGSEPQALVPPASSSFTMVANCVEADPDVLFAVVRSSGDRVAGRQGRHGDVDRPLMFRRASGRAVRRSSVRSRRRRTGRRSRAPRSRRRRRSTTTCRRPAATCGTTRRIRTARTSSTRPQSTVVAPGAIDDAPGRFHAVARVKRARSCPGTSRCRT